MLLHFKEIHSLEKELFGHFESMVVFYETVQEACIVNMTYEGLTTKNCQNNCAPIPHQLVKKLGKTIRRRMRKIDMLV